MEWGAVITALGTIAALVLKLWIQGKPARDERKADEELQQGRQDIIDGNADAVSARIDRLLQKNTSDGATGSKNGEDKGR